MLRGPLPALAASSFLAFSSVTACQYAGPSYAETLTDALPALFFSRKALSSSSSSRLSFFAALRGLALPPGGRGQRHSRPQSGLCKLTFSALSTHIESVFGRGLGS